LTTLSNRGICVVCYQTYTRCVIIFCPFFPVSMYEFHFSLATMHCSIWCHAALVGARVCLFQLHVVVSCIEFLRLSSPVRLIFWLWDWFSPDELLQYYTWATVFLGPIGFRMRHPSLHQRSLAEVEQPLLSQAAQKRGWILYPTSQVCLLFLHHLRQTELEMQASKQAQLT
jgi:hypothetical protein